MVFACIGFIFTIIDTVLFILKKPLIYHFEYKHFVELDSVQQIIQNLNAEAEIQENDKNNAIGNLQKLKEMLDNGLISEAEYEQKKSEVLNKF